MLGRLVEGEIKACPKGVGRLFYQLFEAVKHT